MLEAAPEQAGFGDAQLRHALWTQLGQAEGPLARQCFNETVAKLSEARNAELKERIENAAYQQYAIEKLAAAANVDDFDPQWIDAAKSIGGSGSSKSAHRRQDRETVARPVRHFGLDVAEGLSAVDRRQRQGRAAEAQGQTL